MSVSRIEPKNGRANQDKLLPAERVFAAEYMSNGFNASAAIAIAWPRMGKKHSGTYSAQVLKRKRVREYLSKLLHARLKDTGLAADRILRKLEMVLFLDPLDFFEPGDIDGVYKLRPLDEIPEEVRQCINKLKVRSRTDPETGDTEVFMEVEFMSKDKAMEMAMKYQGLMVEGAGLQVNLNSQPKVDFDELCEPPELDAIESTGQLLLEGPEENQDEGDAE